jgi:serine/threonine-protein kinase
VLEAQEASATVSYQAASTEQFESSDLRLPQVQHLFVAGSVIGTGGNGEVLAARQVSLERTIAVKRPLRELRSRSKVDELLREAKVTGYLEHPNIPPIHFVGEGDDAEDLIIGLKHIEGSEFLSELSKGDRSENLDDALDVLTSACDAVGYAHDLGVLHLDLKPANVMIGKYGEVYVLDWGLALAFRDDVPDTIPRFVATGRFCGTPAYGAPETVADQPPSPATDVYQLGGMLYRILTGWPPNWGATTYEVLEAAYKGSKREFGPWVSAGLAAICTKALARNPGERYSDANEFRRALASYRRNVREFEAFERAKACVEELEYLLQSQHEPSEVYRSYGAARLAFIEYARLDTDGDAVPMRAKAVRSMLNWELERENAGGAELLLEELPGEDFNARRAIDEIKERQRSDQRELAYHRKENDPNQGRWPRFFFWMSIGFIIFLTEAIPFALDVPVEPQRVLGGHTAFLLLLAVVTLALRKKLNTRTNRQIISLVWVMSTFGLALRLAAFVGKLELPMVVSLDLCLVALVSAYGALHIDRRVTVAVPLYLVFAGVAAVVPELAMLTFGIGHFISLTAVAAVTTFFSAGAD